MNRPMLALDVSEELRYRRFDDRCTVRGQWPAITEQILDALVIASLDSTEPIFWPTGTAGELIVTTDRGAWARVRVTVEVLDGIP